MDTGTKSERFINQVMEEVRNARRLKVNQRVSPRASRDVTIPELVLSGLWLVKAGFGCDSYVLVRPEEGRLIIEIEGGGGG
jgi:hypothetical protein